MSNCIVVWEDGGGVIAPMGWDESCEGAICWSKSEIVVFDSPKKARQAIRISELWNRTLHAQGKPFNDDFVGGKKNLKIVKVKFAED